MQKHKKEPTTKYTLTLKDNANNKIFFKSNTDLLFVACMEDVKKNGYGRTYGGYFYDKNVKNETFVQHLADCIYKLSITKNELIDPAIDMLCKEVGKNE